MIVPPWCGEATVEPFEIERKQGFKIILAENSQTIFLLKKTLKPKLEWTHVIHLRDEGFDYATAVMLDLSEARWAKHPEEEYPFTDLTEYEHNAESVRKSWIDAFLYKREDDERNIMGLRPPQLGAIYAVQAHWTVNREPATIVLPTGIGKTETMLSLLVVESCERLLVVVPTDALRLQIAVKFLLFGLLKTPHFGVILEKARYPVVGTLMKRPTDTQQVGSLFRKCNVIVTTMPLANQCSPEVMDSMAELSSNLFIDEAHHVAAPKWKEFKDIFKKKRVLQFTATPFRNDDRPVGGKRIFTFSLRDAQQQGYFKKIHFKPVFEFDPALKDIAIAEAAVEQLRADAHLGHILMARTGDVSRAKKVFECYRKYEEFNPVEIHTGIKSKVEREDIRRKLLSGESRIVVCVDMLGEGFDLPELKIAAFHDIRKTLAVTLQLVGRFTRTKPSLGNATVVANIADLEVKDELKKLYQHDSDWNALLPLINERVSSGEASLGEFLAGFQELPDEITLQNVRPSMSMVAYRTNCSRWAPENFAHGITGYDSLDRVYPTTNPQGNTLVVVTTRRVSVDWAQIDEIHNWDWQLYVLHWDKEKSLLFIHNSSNSGFFKKLAQAVAGDDVEQIRGPLIFRCLSGVNRLKLQNVGLLEQLGRLIRYIMRAGSDIEPGLSEAQKENTIKANLFGQGFENGHRSTIGCSYKGRIWSYRKTNLLELTTWCRAVGEKLLNESLDPEEVLGGTLVPTWISKRPQQIPIAVEWPDIFYKEPEQIFSFQINGIDVYRHDIDLNVVDPENNGALKFELSSSVASAKFELSLFENNGNPDFSIKEIDMSNVIISYRNTSLPLREFFQEDPPTFWFADGSSLSGIEYVALQKQPEPFPRTRIETWDWTGTRIRSESQGVDKNPESIQYRVIAEIKKRGFSVIFDDDDRGEAADIVAILEHDEYIEVEFWHCKFALADQPGSRIKELYELCGQAQTSIRWLDKKRDLFTHLMRREPKRYQEKESTRYEVGTEKDLLRIREKVDSQRVALQVVIVQPGLSRTGASQKQLELLAVTENYLLETFKVPLNVVGSD